MKTPLLWNTLADIGAFLAEHTGEQWTERAVLDLAVNILDQTRRDPPMTYLSAALPANTVVNAYKWVSPAEAHRLGITDSFLPLWPVSRLTAPLAPIHVAELLVRGETKLGLANSRSGPDVDEHGATLYCFLDPPLTVTPTMVGAGEQSLLSLAHFAMARGALAPATAQVPAPEPVGPKRTRADLLSGEIEAAIAELGGAKVPALIMRCLKSYAGRPHSCIADPGTNFVIWRDANGTPQKLTQDNLRKRLKRLADRGRQ